MDIFKLKENQTTVGREIVAGMVTFMAMAYIIFVNPKILAAAMGNELFPALVLATCLGAGILSILMGLVSNYPLALASGMGLNAFLAYGVIMGMKVPWQTAMGIIFIEGAIITLLVLTNVRKQVMNAIPLDLKRGIGVGIGLLITLVGLENAKLIVPSPATFLTFGKLGPENLIAIAGVLLSAWLMAKKIKGAFLLGIIFCTVMAVLAGLVSLPKVWVAGIKPEYFKTIFALDIAGALRLGLLTTIFAFLITDFFDTMGTVVAVGEQGGFMDRDGKIPRLEKYPAGRFVGGCQRRFAGLQFGDHLCGKRRRSRRRRSNRPDLGGYRMPFSAGGFFHAHRGHRSRLCHGAGLDPGRFFADIRCALHLLG